ADRIERRRVRGAVAGAGLVVVDTTRARRHQGRHKCAPDQAPDTAPDTAPDATPHQTPGTAPDAAPGRAPDTAPLRLTHAPCRHRYSLTRGAMPTTTANAASVDSAMMRSG